MRNRIFHAIAAILFTALSSTAQIGYQMAVIDQTTGVPKANTSVSVNITLTDNVGTEICSESRTVTTDDFGIVSMQIGNATTFDNVNWSNLPLWVSAKVDGVTISKTQVLSVPVAEHAKHTGTLTIKKLCSKTWTNVEISDYKYTFTSNMTYRRTWTGDDESGIYCISGDMVMIKVGTTAKLLAYMESVDALIDVYERRIYK